jgi:hypothetical protein
MTEQESDNGWNDLIGTDYEDLPFDHERDDGLGWYYKDDGYGGYIVVAETKAEIEGREIKLGIGIEFVEIGHLQGLSSDFSAQAHAVVHPSCLSNEALGNVGGSSGTKDLTYFDVALYGYRVPIEDVPCDDWEVGYTELKDELAFADMAVGFLLDRAYNRMGNTGWDILRDATESEFDSTEAALERHREKEADV